MEKRKRGGQPGNKNALGNRGGGAPYGNKNAVTHGAYSAWAALQRARQDPALFGGLDLAGRHAKRIRLNQVFICRLWNLEGKHELAMLATSGLISRLISENGRLFDKLAKLRGICAGIRGI